MSEIINTPNNNTNMNNTPNINKLMESIQQLYDMQQMNNNVDPIEKMFVNEPEQSQQESTLIDKAGKIIQHVNYISDSIEAHQSIEQSKFPRTTKLEKTGVSNSQQANMEPHTNVKQPTPSIAADNTTTADSTIEQASSTPKNLKTSPETQHLVNTSQAGSSHTSVSIGDTKIPIGQTTIKNQPAKIVIEHFATPSTAVTTADKQAELLLSRDENIQLYLKEYFTATQIYTEEMLNNLKEVATNNNFDLSDETITNFIKETFGKKDNQIDAGIGAELRKHLEEIKEHLPVGSTLKTEIESILNTVKDSKLTTAVLSSPGVLNVVTEKIYADAITKIQAGESALKEAAILKQLNTDAKHIVNGTKAAHGGGILKHLGVLFSAYQLAQAANTAGYGEGIAGMVATVYGGYLLFSQSLEIAKGLKFLALSNKNPELGQALNMLKLSWKGKLPKFMKVNNPTLQKFATTVALRGGLLGTITAYTTTSFYTWAGRLQALISHPLAQKTAAFTSKLGLKAAELITGIPIKTLMANGIEHINAKVASQVGKATSDIMHILSQKLTKEIMPNIVGVSTSASKLMIENVENLQTWLSTRSKKLKKTKKVIAKKATPKNAKAAEKLKKQGKKGADKFSKLMKTLAVAGAILQNAQTGDVLGAMKSITKLTIGWVVSSVIGAILAPLMAVITFLLQFLLINSLAALLILLITMLLSFLAYNFMYNDSAPTFTQNTLDAVVTSFVYGKSSVATPEDKGFACGIYQSLHNAKQIFPGQGVEDVYQNALSIFSTPTSFLKNTDNVMSKYLGSNEGEDINKSAIEPAKDVLNQDIVCFSNSYRQIASTRQILPTLLTSVKTLFNKLTGEQPMAASSVVEYNFSQLKNHIQSLSNLWRVDNETTSNTDDECVQWAYKEISTGSTTTRVKDYCAQYKSVSTYTYTEYGTSVESKDIEIRISFDTHIPGDPFKTSEYSYYTTEVVLTPKKLKEGDYMLSGTINIYSVAKGAPKQLVKSIPMVFIPTTDNAADSLTKVITQLSDDVGNMAQTGARIYTLQDTMMQPLATLYQYLSYEGIYRILMNGWDPHDKTWLSWFESDNPDTDRLQLFYSGRYYRPSTTIHSNGVLGDRQIEEQNKHLLRPLDISFDSTIEQDIYDNIDNKDLQRLRFGVTSFATSLLFGKYPIIDMGPWAAGGSNIPFVLQSAWLQTQVLNEALQTVEASTTLGSTYNSVLAIATLPQNGGIYGGIVTMMPEWEYMKKYVAQWLGNPKQVFNSYLTRLAMRYARLSATNFGGDGRFIFSTPHFVGINPIDNINLREDYQIKRGTTLFYDPGFASEPETIGGYAIYFLDSDIVGNDNAQFSSPVLANLSGIKNIEQGKEAAINSLIDELKQLRTTYYHIPVNLDYIKKRDKQYNGEFATHVMGNLHIPSVYMGNNKYHVSLSSMLYQGKRIGAPYITVKVRAVSPSYKYRKVSVRTVRFIYYNKIGDFVEPVRIKTISTRTVREVSINLPASALSTPHSIPYLGYINALAVTAISPQTNAAHTDSSFPGEMWLLTDVPIGTNKYYEDAEVTNQLNRILAQLSSGALTSLPVHTQWTDSQINTFLTKYGGPSLSQLEEKVRVTIAYTSQTSRSISEISFGAFGSRSFITEPPKTHTAKGYIYAHVVPNPSRALWQWAKDNDLLGNANSLHSFFSSYRFPTQPFITNTFDYADIYFINKVYKPVLTNLSDYINSLYLLTVDDVVNHFGQWMVYNKPELAGKQVIDMFIDNMQDVLIDNETIGVPVGESYPVLNYVKTGHDINELWLAYTAKLLGKTPQADTGDDVNPDQLNTFDNGDWITEYGNSTVSRIEVYAYTYPTTKVRAAQAGLKYLAYSSIPLIYGYENFYTHPNTIDNDLLTSIYKAALSNIDPYTHTKDQVLLVGNAYMVGMLDKKTTTTYKDFYIVNTSPTATGEVSGTWKDKPIIKMRFKSYPVPSGVGYTQNPLFIQLVEEASGTACSPGSGFPQLLPEFISTQPVHVVEKALNDAGVITGSITKYFSITRLKVMRHGKTLWGYYRKSRFCVLQPISLTEQGGRIVPIYRLVTMSDIYNMENQADIFTQISLSRPVGINLFDAKEVDTLPDTFKYYIEKMANSSSPLGRLAKSVLNGMRTYTDASDFIDEYTPILFKCAGIRSQHNDEEYLREICSPFMNRTTQMLWRWSLTYKVLYEYATTILWQDYLAHIDYYVRTCTGHANDIPTLYGSFVRFATGQLNKEQSQCVINNLKKFKNITPPYDITITGDMRINKDNIPRDTISANVLPPVDNYKYVAKWMDAIATQISGAAHNSKYVAPDYIGINVGTYTSYTSTVSNMPILHPLVNWEDPDNANRENYFLFGKDDYERWITSWLKYFFNPTPNS